MKRRHLRGDAVAFCERARALRPDLVFGADIIAGFPTETEAMFENSLRLIEDCDLTWLHVFPYSPRPRDSRGPDAAGRWRSDPRSRGAGLGPPGAHAVTRHLAGQVAREHSVLMESPTMGRTKQFTEVRFAAPQPEGRPGDGAGDGRCGDPSLQPDPLAGP